MSTFVYNHKSSADFPLNLTEVTDVLVEIIERVDTPKRIGGIKQDGTEPLTTCVPIDGRVMVALLGVRVGSGLHDLNEAELEYMRLLKRNLGKRGITLVQTHALYWLLTKVCIKEGNQLHFNALYSLIDLACQSPNNIEVTSKNVKIK